MVSEEKRKVISLFEEGRLLYKKRAFREAMQKFAMALKIDKGDGPSQIYYARCRHYAVNPPSKDWDGVWVMTAK